MRRAPLLLLAVFLLVGCAEPEPVPERRIEATAVPLRPVMFFPVYFLEAEGCIFAEGKSLAWNKEREEPGSADKLCIATGTPYLNWSSRPGTDSRLDHVPMLWGARTEDLLRDLPPDFQGVVAGPNEPDRIDQAGRYWCTQTPVGVDCGDAPAGAAAVMVEVEEARPGVRWIAPSWSNAASDCQQQAVWWFEYIGQGGDPDNVTAFGFHIYPDGRGLTAVEKVDQCFETLEAAGVPFRPLWVTEIGHTLCNASGAAELERWVSSLLADERVEIVAGYAPYASAPFCPFVDGAGGLTLIGEAFRNG